MLFLCVSVGALELFVTWHLVRFAAQRFGNYAECLQEHLRAARLIVER